MRRCLAGMRILSPGSPSLHHHFVSPPGRGITSIMERRSV